MITIIQVNELTNFDYQILEFVNSYDEISEKEIISKFSSDEEVTNLRIQFLSTPDMTPYRSISNTCYLEKTYKSLTHGKYEYTGNVKINPLGKKVLQDYFDSKKAEKHKKCEERVWRAIPIAISILALIISFYSLLKSYKSV